MEAPEERDQPHLTLPSGTDESRQIDGKERMRIEFYETYDVMTGIRIAATLGGFFSMMILLVLYKNYCKPSKTLSEEQLNAAVTAAAEEEDRALAEALEATSFYTSLEKRQSLSSASPALCSPRFSSVGGGFSHLAPPVRLPFLQQRGKSLPGSTLRFMSTTNRPEDQKETQTADYSDEEDFDIECQLPGYSAYGNYLSVPADRRLSSITCSSADSSYLERRGSAFEMGLPAPPPFLRQHDKHCPRPEEHWDFYYPIDIQVIQPTPEVSPSTSEKTLNEEPTHYGLQVPGFQDRMHRLSVDRSEIGNSTGLAPLASISSLGSFSSNSLLSMGRRGHSNKEEAIQGCSCHEDSVGSDSVFMDEIDTEDEAEEFSTDSEFEYDGFDDDYSFCESRQRPISRCENRTLQFASFDSYDASIAQDSLSEEKNDQPKTVKKQPEETNQNTRALSRQYSTDLRRQHSVCDGVRVKRKLVKTHSEPRTQRHLKQLPPWIEKGRSGYIPKRQFSVPSKRKRNSLENPGEIGKTTTEEEEETPDHPQIKEPEISKELTKTKTPNLEPSQEEEHAKDLSPRCPLPLPSNSSSSDSLTLTPSVENVGDAAQTSQIQGQNNDLPSTPTTPTTPATTSLTQTQGKRGRFQKQKTIRPKETVEKEDGKTLTASLIVKPIHAGGLLKPPNVTITRSCEKLNAPNLYGPALGIPTINIDAGSCERLNVIGNNSPETETHQHELFITSTSNQDATS